LFYKDREGVVELPFKLVIASIILIVTISVAYAGLENFSERTITDRVETAVASISSTAGEVSTMGINSSLNVKADLTSSIFHRVEDFKVGCKEGEDDYKCKGIEYKVTGHKGTWKVVKDHAGHDLVMKGIDGKSCSLADGSHEVLIVKAPDHLLVSVV